MKDTEEIEQLETFLSILKSMRKGVKIDLIYLDDFIKLYKEEIKSKRKENGNK